MTRSIWYLQAADMDDYRTKLTQGLLLVVQHAKNMHVTSLARPPPSIKGPMCNI